VGSAKRNLAIHLAERLWRDHQLDLLVWIPAGTRQSILAGYAQAATDLNITTASGAGPEQDPARFHAWLTGTTRRWLIVLDDLTSAANLQRLWPPHTPTGRTVITTRLRGAVLHGTGRRLITVGEFSEDEAVGYLRARLADHPDLADDAGGVAADPGRLPLALAQAAAFMLDEHIPCSEYRRRFALRRARLDDLVPDPHSPAGLPDDHQRTVAPTLAMSIHAAHSARPAGLARPLLELAGVLNPAGIPIAVLTTAAASRWLGEHTAGAVETLEYLLTDQLRALGPDHPHTLEVSSQLAFRRGQAGHTAGAVETPEHLLTDQLTNTRTRPPTHLEHPQLSSQLARRSRKRCSRRSRIGAIAP